MPLLFIHLFIVWCLQQQHARGILQQHDACYHLLFFYYKFYHLVSAAGDVAVASQLLTASMRLPSGAVMRCVLRRGSWIHVIIVGFMWIQVDSWPEGDKSWPEGVESWPDRVKGFIARGGGIMARGGGCMARGGGFMARGGGFMA
jgi:hypothetical protein